jgi:gamma-glutamylcyclotransferase (GGCT)/AIG2-like uncharacterized protein YtfP
MSHTPDEMDALNAAVRALNANGQSRETLALLRGLLRRLGAVEDVDDMGLGRLVVYGTLAPGRSNHHMVAGIPGEWFTGWVEGDFHEHGWGAAEGFPAMTWRPGGGRIDVHVLESSELRQHWSRLDEFEGSAYRRTFIPVFRDGVPPVIGEIYEARFGRRQDC